MATIIPEEINLNKNEIIVLDKGLEELEVNINWVNKRDGDDYEVDVDLACLCLGKNKKAVYPVMENFLYFRTPTKNKEGKRCLHNGGIVHSGDDLGGNDEFDEDGNAISSEQIIVDTNLIPSGVKEIMFIVTIANGLTFKDTVDSNIDVSSNGKMYAHYDISNTFKRRDNSIIPGALIYENGGWSFQAKGDASEDDLTAVLYANCDNITVTKKK